MLAITGKDGICHTTVGGLASLARITKEQAANAVEVLSSPDPDSMTDDENEGRRIERAEDGWRLLTWGKYRNLAKAVASREANAERQAEHRAKQKEIAWPVLVYLNEKTGKKFRDTETNMGLIAARMAEPDVTLEGIKKMIDRQVAKWSGDKMEEYLRPETLFGKHKFDGYYAAKDLPVITEAIRVAPHTQMESLKAMIAKTQKELDRVPLPDKNLYPEEYQRASETRVPLMAKLKQYRRQKEELDELMVNGGGR